MVLRLGFAMAAGRGLNRPRPTGDLCPGTTAGAGAGAGGRGGCTCSSGDGRGGGRTRALFSRIVAVGGVGGGGGWGNKGQTCRGRGMLVLGSPSWPESPSHPSSLSAGSWTIAVVPRLRAFFRSSSFGGGGGAGLGLAMPVGPPRPHPHSRSLPGAGRASPLRRFQRQADVTADMK